MSKTIDLTRQEVIEIRKTLLHKDEWYKTLEPRVREVVKLLRNNGINTECSCEHEKYVQCQFNIDGLAKKVDDLLFNNKYRNYQIDITIRREEGFVRSSMEITFKDLQENHTP